MHDTHRCVSPERMSVYLDETSSVTTDAADGGLPTLLGLVLGRDPVTYRQIIDHAA